MLLSGKRRVLFCGQKVHREQLALYWWPLKVDFSRPPLGLIY